MKFISIGRVVKHLKQISSIGNRYILFGLLIGSHIPYDVNALAAHGF